MYLNHDKKTGSLDSLANAYDPEAFRQAGKELVDKLADHLQRVQSDSGRPNATTYQDPEPSYREWQRVLNGDSAHGDGGDWWRQLIEGSIHLHNPGYMGHQISPSLPIAALAGLVADFLNNGMGVYEMGQAATAIERVVVEAVAKKLGMADEAGGFMTSGGTLGNLTALLTARRLKAPGDVWHEGLRDHPQLVVFVSEQAHYCIDRAARIMGLGREGVWKIPVDEQFRMRTELLPDYLEEAHRLGMHAFAVVGSACTTSTGTYDDLNAIADFCGSHDLWFHVDGAHGAAAAFSKKYRGQVSGIERANSVVMDFHKTMMVPALSTAIVYKNHRNAYSTFSQQAQYLWNAAETEEWHELTKRTFECTKYMMSIKVFSVLQSYGFEIFEDYVDRCFDLGTSFGNTLESLPDFELACKPKCNIVCFRVVRPDWTNETTNRVNAEIRRAVLLKGQFYIVQTELNGKRFLRVTLTNPLTKSSDLDLLIQQIQSIASNIE